MSLVVDASMTIAWLFRDERPETPQSVLRRVAREGAWVPSLWRLEVANVLCNAVRRKRCDEGYATRCLARLGRLGILVDPETNAQAWGRPGSCRSRTI
jgi:predicted nucleic acid-binding protein